jgi:hypothetical protein
LALLVLIGLAVMAALPSGPYRYETGRVTGFVLLPREPKRHVVIRLEDGREIQRRMGFEVDCLVGDYIAIEHNERLLIGDNYAVSGQFPCKRPPLP